MSTQIYKLNSGLRIAHNYRPYVRSVGFCVMCGVGSYNEVDSNNGISHYIEHMYFKGTKTRNSFDIVNELEEKGIQVNAFTTKQATCFYTISVDDCVEKGVEVLSDILLNSTFDKEEMEREKKVVIEEIAMTEDENDSLVYDLFSEGFYKGNPLSRSIIGTKENVKSFTQEDIKQYIRNNYCAEDIVIGVVGNIALEKTIELVEKYFEGKFSNILNRNWKDEKAKTNQAYMSKFKDIEQCNILLGFPGLSLTSSRGMELNVLTNIFGGGMSSKLFQEIREKNGLAYQVYSSSTNYINNGYVDVYIGTNLKSVNKSIIKTVKLINEIKNKGFTQEEINKGVAQVKSVYVLGQESTSSMMRAVTKSALFEDKEFDIDEKINSLNNITRDSIMDLFREIFDFSKVAIAYIGRKIDDNLLDIILDKNK